MIAIRAATPTDEPLIFATWLRAFKHGSAFPRHIPDRVFFDEHHDVVEQLLERSTVTVATPVDDTDVILSWSAVETVEPVDGGPSPLVVHFVYTKPAFRRTGIARQLLAHVARELDAGTPVFYSHETFLIRQPGIARHVARAFFNPYAALRVAAKGGNGNADD